MRPDRSGPQAEPEGREDTTVTATRPGESAPRVALTCDATRDPVSVIETHGLWPYVLTAYQRGWDDCLDHVADQVGGTTMPATLSEEHVRRWGPGGRAHYADPRPGDYLGERGAA